MTKLLENKSIEEIKNWFEEHDYNSEEIEIGYFGITPEGFQDADFFEIEEAGSDSYNLIVK